MGAVQTPGGCHSYCAPVLAFLQPSLGAASQQAASRTCLPPAPGFGILRVWLGPVRKGHRHASKDCVDDVMIPP